MVPSLNIKLSIYVPCGKVKYNSFVFSELSETNNKFPITSYIIRDVNGFMTSSYKSFIWLCLFTSDSNKFLLILSVKYG